MKMQMPVLSPSTEFIPSEAEGLRTSLSKGLNWDLVRLRPPGADYGGLIIGIWLIWYFASLSLPLGKIMVILYLSLMSELQNETI